MTTAECEAWCKAHARKWQVLNRSEWKYAFRGKTLVRYVDEVQLREDEITSLLDYLSSDDCISKLSLYDQSVSGSWKPVRAWIEISNKSVGAVHGIRLYHGLCTEPSSHADGPFVVEDGCAYKVSFEYHWGESDAPTVQQSESGVSYRIGNLVRDPDTNLFNYTIEKRERVMQDVPYYLTSESKDCKTYEELYLGVRESAVDSTGPQASAGSGKIVHRKVSKNQDCTKDIHCTTLVAKAWIETSDWVAGDYHHYVVKYGNQTEKYAGVSVPTDTNSVSKNDTVNDFELHDGQLSWTYGGTSGSAKPTKFNKHGSHQTMIEYARAPETRRWAKRTWTVQLQWISGDAYTDYVSDEMSQDISRKTSGVLAVNLLNTYYEDGTLLAVWKKVNLLSVGEWSYCDSSDKNPVESKPSDFSNFVYGILGVHRGSNGSGENKIADALNALPNALSIIHLGQTFEQRKKVVSED